MVSLAPAFFGDPRRSRSEAVFRLRGGEPKRGGKRETPVAEPFAKGFEKHERLEPVWEG
jgi:hypothetical protein